MVNFFYVYIYNHLRLTLAYYMKGLQPPYVIISKSETLMSLPIL